jgi:hypothetical protein
VVIGIATGLALAPAVLAVGLLAPAWQASLAAPATPAPGLAPLPAAVGEATYYADGLMQRVYERRLVWGHVAPCPECAGLVALLDCRHVGRKAWLRHPLGEVVGPLLVVDCAAREDAPALRRRGWVADLPWELGRLRWGMRGPLRGVRVYFRDPVPAGRAGRPTRRPGSRAGRLRAV